MIHMQPRQTALLTSLPQRSFFNRGAKEEGKKTEEPKTNDPPKKEDVKEEAKTESSDSEKESDFTKEDVKKIKQLFNEQEKEIEALNKHVEDLKAAVEK